MPPECHLGVDAVGQHAPAFLLQVGGGLGELRHVVQAGVGGATSPEGQRLVEQGGGHLGVALAERAAAPFGEVREVPGVHLGPLSEQRVPGAVVPDPVGAAQRPAQPVHEHLEVLAWACGQALTPQRVGQRVGGHRTAAPADQEPQQLFLAP